MKKRKWILKTRDLKLFLYKDLETKKVVFWDLTTPAIYLGITTLAVLLYKALML